MKITAATFIGVDTETTGLDPATDQLVEVALRVVSFDGSPFMKSYETLVRPSIPIPATASAVHHLTDEDVAGAPDREEVGGWIRRIADEHPDAIIFAHNAAFDSGFIPELRARRWLCTKRLAQHVFPDAPAFNNQVLRYWLGHDKISLEGKLPHRAAADIIVTEAILWSEVDEYLQHNGDDLEAFLTFADAPVFMKTMPFGKHRGPMVDVPTDYIRWALGPRGLTEIDPDLRFTLETILLQRANAA